PLPTYTLPPATPLCVSSPCHLRDRHSFPTRRSSDLVRVITKIYTQVIFIGSKLLANPLGRHRSAHNKRTFNIKRALRMFNKLNTDRKSTRLNSSHVKISYAVFCLKKKKTDRIPDYSV